ncbi:MAG: sensor histidine kinase [Dehalococcoidia bacterium]
MTHRWARFATSSLALDWGPSVIGLAISLLAPVVQDAANFGPASVAIALVLTGCIAVRRRYTLAAHVIVLTATAIDVAQAPTVQQASFLGFFALMLTTNAVAASSRSNRTVVLTVASCLLFNVAVFMRGSFDAAIEFAPVPVWTAVAAIIGRTFRNRAQLLALLEDRAAHAERERQQERARAVAEERARIAMELHDIVAHGVSVMVVQAGGARLVADSDPAAAKRAMETIEQTGRASLVEMRRLVGLLRMDDAEAALAPAPGIARIDELADEMKRAGLAVHISISGDVRPLVAGLDLAAYRVIQESLTNVLKHAHVAEASVRLYFARSALEIEVENLGERASVEEIGNGLIGMRQRVGMFGGNVDAGPRQQGGFFVRATIPFEEAPAV